jgi:hypothetical protein
VRPLGHGGGARRRRPSSTAAVGVVSGFGKALAGSGAFTEEALRFGGNGGRTGAPAQRARGSGWSALRACGSRPRGAGFGGDGGASWSRFGGGAVEPGVLWCWQFCPAALGPSRASPSSSTDGVGGGQIAQIC